MAEPGEVEFLRRALVGAGLLPAARLDAWLARWSGEGSFLQHLVEVGALERNAAAALTAVMKGKLRLSNEALRGLIRLDVGGEGAGDGGATPRATAMQPAAVSTSRGAVDAAVSTSRGVVDAAVSASRGAVDASASTSHGAVDATVSMSGVVDASASMSHGAVDASASMSGVIDASASTSRGAIDRPASTGRPRGSAVSMSLGARALASLIEDRSAPASTTDDASGEVVGEAPMSTSRGSTSRGAASGPRGRGGRGRTREPDISPQLRAAVDAALGALEDAATGASGEPGLTWTEAVPKDRSRVRSFPPAVGDVVAGYQLRKLLGSGAGGAVYRGWSAEQGHSVVLKLLRPTGEGPGAVAAAHAAVHRRLRHPGVVTLLAAGEDAGLAYLVFEDLFALSLADYLEVTGPLPSVRVARIGVDVGETMAAAAEHGIVHGELEPGNLLVYSSDARIKLSDFAGPTGAREPRGTPPYRAPERVTGAPADVRADMYSLGATLYHAATGRPPFVRQAVDAARDPVTVAARPVHMLVPAFSRALSGLIARLMSERPDERPGSWGEVVAGLIAAEPAAAAVRSDMSDRPAEVRA